MTNSEQVAASILKLRPDQFFAQDLDLSKQEFELLKVGFQGVAVNAPESIDTGKQTKLPLVVGIGKTTRRQWEIYEPKNLSLVAWTPETAEVFLADAAPPRIKRPPVEIVSRMPPEPSEKPPYGLTASIRRIEDVHGTLSLPWQPGRVRLAVIHHDWLSNVVEVQLTGEKEPAEGAQVKVRPEPRADAPEAQGGWMSKAFGQAKFTLPCYETTPVSPKLAGEGLALAVGDKLVASDRLPVYGTFAVKAREWHLREAGTVHLGQGGKKLPVVAVVPVTLLVVALDLPIPHRFDWGVPVYGEAPARTGGVLRGNFAIDALAGGQMRLDAGTYQAYAICDTYIQGPQSFTV
jgi:hypothetical protein